MSPARVAVIGAGWWSQGWHLPHLSRHSSATLVAIVEPSKKIRSTLNPEIEQLDALGRKYGVPTFETFKELLAAGLQLDGVVIGASHKAHYDLGIQAIAAGLHVFMEKPMTTDPVEASSLLSAVQHSGLIFMVNNTANWQKQTVMAHEWVSTGRIGEVEHVSCSMGSPLLWLFDDPANEGWVQPSGKMCGNGMGWGQLSHTLAWVIKVTGLIPATVYAEMNHSKVTGADRYDAAIIRCTNGAIINLQGMATVAGEKPASADDMRPMGKQIENRIFGSEGMIVYSGLDHRRESGSLLVRRHDFALDEEHAGFEFEEGSQDGIGPASLQAFVAGCRGEEVWNGCDAEVGFRVVAILDAMYRSAVSGAKVNALCAQNSDAAAASPASTSKKRERE